MFTTDNISINNLRCLLKEKTQDAHKSLEDALGIMNSDLSPDRLFEILRALLQFHIAFEISVAEKARRGSDLADDYLANRKKSSWFSKSIVLSDVKARMVDLSWLKSEADLLGAIYVIEGSMLGGAVVGPHLRRKGFPGDQIRYFSGYGSESGLRWQEVVQRLSQSPATDWDTVITSAIRTFQTLEELATEPCTRA